MGLGNFGLTEIVAIVVLVLIFFGPKELPEIVRTLARLFRDLRRSVNEVVREFDELQRMDEEGGAGGGRGRSGEAPRAGERVLPPGARGRAEPGPGAAGDGEARGASTSEASGAAAGEAEVEDGAEGDVDADVRAPGRVSGRTDADGDADDG